MESQTPTRRPDSGESLQDMTETLINDLKLNSDVDIVFTRLIGPSDQDVNGLLLDKQTSEGDTILHRIVHATVDLPGNMKYYMQIVDKICARSAQWYHSRFVVNNEQNREQNSDNVEQFHETDGQNNENDHQSNDSDQQNAVSHEQNDDNEKNYRYKGMIQLLENTKDKCQRNIWHLAINKVAIEMIEKLMYLEGVTCLNNTVFDVSNFVHMDFSFGNVNMFSLISTCTLEYDNENLLKLLEQTRDENRYDELMKVKPVKKLTDVLCSISTKIHIVLLVLHIMYMSLYSYLACDLMDVRNEALSNTTDGLINSFGLTELFLLTFYVLIKLTKFLSLKRLKEELAKFRIKTRTCLQAILRFIFIVVYLLSLYIVIGSAGYDITPFHRNILSLSLLLGWLLTLALANGIRQVNFFFKLVLRVIFQDVLKIIFVYIIFLLAFSLSIHAQFISSVNVTMTYKTPIHTMYLMFNVMVGMEEAVDQNTEIYLEAASARPLVYKLIYIGYVLCSTIVLLNLLIVMMNKSYTAIEFVHLNEWVYNAVYFGINIAKYLPPIANILGANKIEKQQLFNYSQYKRTIKLTQSDLQPYYSPYEALQVEMLDIKRTLNELMNLLKSPQRKQIPRVGGNRVHPQSPETPADVAEVQLLQSDTSQN